MAEGANPRVIEEEQREHEVTTSTVLESLPQEMKGRIEALGRRPEPVNILVVGPTGVGKSTLVNALLGGIVAEVQRGATSVTAEMSMHEGKFMGVKIRVYDTVGFGDSEERSSLSEIKEMVKANKFDLILACVKMDCRADEGVKKMFTTLSSIMPTEAWKRTVVVLTFANFFLLQGPSSTPDEQKEKEMKEEIKTFRNQISKAVNKEAFSDVPFHIAGRIGTEKGKLPTTDDWLCDLWVTCLQQCSDEARPLFQAYSVAAVIAFSAAGAAVVGSAAGLVGVGIGVVIGAATGTVVKPGAGTALGAALGAKIGGVIGGAVGSIAGGVLGGIVGRLVGVVKKISTKEKKD